VKVPSFSACEAAGTKKTSVPIVSGASSPVSISGASYQKLADSISCRSRTTSHSRLASPRRFMRAFGCPTAGFSPTRK
jgi:hypothetical protein